MIVRYLLLLATLLACSCWAEQAIIASRVYQSSRWMIERQAEPEETISFKILLKQQNLDKLEQIFWEVNNPKNDNYGNYLSREDVASLVAPEPASVQRVLQWLKTAGIKQKSLRLSSDFIKVTTNVHTAASLFSAEFVHYRSTKTNSARLRIHGTASVPSHLLDDIDFVVGISELIDKDAKKQAQPALSSLDDDDDGYIFPAVLKNFYQIPQNMTGSNVTTQGIAAFDDYFSMGALNAFDQFYHVTGVNVTRLGPDCFNETCDQYESDLDIQYITALAPGVPTTFLAHANGEWILDWAQQLATYPNPPLVNSISYGWPELEQCEITEDCSTLGYTSQQYVMRTDDELKKLGSMGITVLVSSGDDGAPSYYGASGNCPLDANAYCTLGGCNYTSTSCAEFVVYFPANNSLCQVPSALEASQDCADMAQDKNFVPALEQWLNSNSACSANLDQDREGNYYFYSTCNCSALQTGTYNGYTFEPYTFNISNGAVFTAEYPTSSPYVTSVGATQFLWSGGNVTDEVGASIATGAKITTGGGFSTFQLAPEYQGAAVNAYLKSGVALPPSFSFNASYRGYPDISFNGHNFLVGVSNNTADLDMCPCLQIPVDGTSASSPSMAGLLSLINSELLASGKSQVGFVNIALYQMFDEDPSAFRDITSGNNACNRAYCCEYGYAATTGWDPIGGLGSPVFPNMLSYFMNAKGLKTN